MLWIQRMIINPEYLSYAMENHTKTMWTYHRDTVLESVLSRQQESTFTIAAGVKKNLSFLFWASSVQSRLCSPRQTILTTASNVSFICLETSHSSNQSLCSDQQYYSIPFEMVDRHKSIRPGNAHSSSETHYIPHHGRQSLWMRSSSRADETIRSWSLVGRPIRVP